MQKTLYRIRAALLKVPEQKDWVDLAWLLTLFALVYLPVGLKLEFIKIELQPSWQTMVSVAVGAFFMPALIEELGFRVLLIPHLTEDLSRGRRWFWAATSWLLFVIYHTHPFVPAFFRMPAFLMGAGLIGAVCTVAYLRSGSIWLPVVLHWLIVVAWLLVFGGLERF